LKSWCKIWRIVGLGVLRGVACLLSYHSGIVGTAALIVSALSKESPVHCIYILTA